MRRAPAARLARVGALMTLGFVALRALNGYGADNFATNCSDLNLTLARLLAARGDDRRAGALLERWRWSGGATPSFVLATLELGRTTERLGDRRKAAECYRFVMAAWRRPDPELLPYVTEAREGLARLGVE